MRLQLLLLACCFVAIVNSQNAGELTPEYHPPLIIQSCDASGCQPENTGIVIDADTRRLYSVADNSVSCYTGSGWNPVLCPDGQTCAQNCAIDGFTQDEYNNRFGISTSGSALRLAYLTQSEMGMNIGSRTYLLGEDNNYRLFYLKNRELSVTFDYSTTTCGMDAGVYFLAMDGDGGMSRYPDNKAGAKYGTGYCDAQCPHYLRYSNGQVNLDVSSEYGICCVEMDIMEANRWAATVTTHGCTAEGYFVCNGVDCGDGANFFEGVCDKSGCDYSSARQNNRYFFGGNDTFTVDSSQPFTVITQFLTDDGSDSGKLVEIKQIWIQNGVEIPVPFANWGYTNDYNSITEEFCAASKTMFGEFNDFAEQGGLESLANAFDNGVVMAFAFWEDPSTYMQWLDSISPPDADPEAPGAYRGPCPLDAGKPEDNHVNYADAYHTISDIKIGTIGSTY
ncbi:Glycosyl Hydrolase 7 [Hyalella azteca]|uniref:cellulose 1,4-beta-cellobiosidase (non-reducing end) n=1 Tax=Hyalella azteca TaxID=294128 RepID=A0A6A0H8Y6_HYAAZ|nr:probable 1,4-beta-D-glucan cellobiohydrolase A [Hyalella azteca]KAA0201485.1 Glycosyl Hydrolase 7 [Hyalella azteca]